MCECTIYKIDILRGTQTTQTLGLVGQQRATECGPHSDCVAVRFCARVCARASNRRWLYFGGSAGCLHRDLIALPDTARPGRHRFDAVPTAPIGVTKRSEPDGVAWMTLTRAHANTPVTFDTYDLGYGSPISVCVCAPVPVCFSDCAVCTSV